MRADTGRWGILWLATAAALALAGCGPLIGQAMRAADGVKAFEVQHGSLAEVGRGQTVLVLGPFAKTDQAYSIARGEDAAGFAEELQRQGLMEADVRVAPIGSALDPDAVRALTPDQLRDRYGLDTAPARVLFGTILERETVIAPTRGVVMIVAYRLEFYDPATRNRTVLRVAVRDLAQRTIPLAVEEIRRRLGEVGS